MSVQLGPDTGVLRTWMEDVYRKHNPGNVDKVDCLLTKYM